MSSWLECCTILGVGENHSAEELRSAYKSQALRHHPDKQGAAGGREATRQFQELQHAYSFLTDPVKRKEYEYAFEAEDDDFFYDEEVMNFFFGPMGRGAGGPCDCFHCSERKLFREELAKNTCYHCGARGEKYAKCPQCTVHFCGAACEAAAAHKVPEDCRVVEQERVASFLPDTLLGTGPAKRGGGKKKTAHKKKKIAAAAVIKRPEVADAKAAAAKRAAEQRAAEDAREKREAEKRENVQRAQLEQVAKQLQAEMGHIEFGRILAAVVRAGGKGKVARRALLEEQENEKRAKKEQKRLRRLQRLEQRIDRLAAQFPELGKKTVAERVREAAGEEQDRAGLDEEEEEDEEEDEEDSFDDTALCAALGKMRDAVVQQRKRAQQREAEAHRETEAHIEAVTGRLAKQFGMIERSRVAAIVRKHGGHEEASATDLTLVRLEQQEADLKKHLARLASVSTALQRRFPEIKADEVREVVDRHGADEAAAAVVLAAMQKRLVRQREAALQEERLREAMRLQEQEMKRIELEKERNDPTLQLRAWLRSVGLASIEYPLVDLDRMDSLAELATWSMQDLQLLNLTDAERFALYSNVQNRQGLQRDFDLEDEDDEELEAEDGRKASNSNAAAAEAAEKAAAAVMADTEEEDEEGDGAHLVSKYSRKSAEGKLVRWMAQSELEYLAPQLFAIGIRSKGQLQQLSDEKLEALPLSIAARDALSRMLAAKRGRKEEHEGVLAEEESVMPSEDEHGVPNFRRPLCKSYLGNSCFSGIKCKYLHSRPCKFTESGKKCPFSELCPYLHPHDKGYSSARERPCRFVAAGQKCHLGDKCQYLHNIHGWRIEADLQGAGENAGPAETGGGASAEDGDSDYDSDQREDVAPPALAPVRAAAEARKCSACGVAAGDWEGHVRSGQHRERLYGRVKSVLERGLDIKDGTAEMVREAFGSWKALAAERSDLFYLEQGVIKLRKVANSLQGAPLLAGKKTNKSKK